MRVRLTFERELEPFCGAEDLLEDHGGIVSDEFCAELLNVCIMEDISSFIFPNNEEKYEPTITLEVVGSEPTNAISHYIKDLKSTIPVDPDEVVVSDYARGCLHTTKHVIAMLGKILKEQGAPNES